MMIGREMEIVEGLPVLYIESLGALVISDLHLGYEGGMAKAGVAIPKANIRSVFEALEKAFDGRKVRKVIVVGDIKNDFSGVIAEELNELRQIVNFVNGKAASLELVMGNHDNFIGKYSSALGIRVYPQQLLVSGYLFAHGDKQLGKEEAEVSTVIIGHEHPSIGIRSRVGTTERLRCFLYGKMPYSGKTADLVVLPAIGYFETGSDINLHNKRRIMSPILRGIDVDQMEAMAIGHGSTLNFGKIGNLRGLEI
jgi:putative SbcD/Mre11-related phosphoesterase